MSRTFKDKRKRDEKHPHRNMPDMPLLAGWDLSEDSATDSSAGQLRELHDGNLRVIRHNTWSRIGDVIKS